VPPLTGTPRILRAINDRAALQLLLSHGALSRSQMGKLTGLSKPTAGELLTRLHKDGLVVERGMTRGGRGPNAQLYAINERAAFVGAVDAAEDYVTVAVADITGHVKGETTSRVDFTAGADPVPVLRALLSRAARRGGLTRRDLKHIVIGFPGVYDEASDSLAFSSHLPGWSEPSMIRRLRDSLGGSLTIENDVNLAAVGERTRGVARDVEGFALLWVGEGLGLAIDIAGSLYRGATGGAGEIGYMPVLGTSRRGRARPASTLQDLVGSPAVLALAGDHGVKAATAAEAVAIAAADHESQPRFLTELASRLATGLATIVAVLDPSLIVLSGTTSLAGGQRLTELVGAELSRISPFRKTVVLSAVPGSPVLAGAVETAVDIVRDELFGLAAVTNV
jgi:predicted NBD/HSP70 family sugar kinase